MAGMSSYSSIPVVGVRPRSQGFALKAILLSVTGLVVVVPLILLIINSFQVARPGEIAVYSLDGWRAALGEEGILRALMHTLSLTAVRQALSLALAICFAWLIARTDIPGRRWLDFPFWIVFFLPSLPMTLGWILLLDPNSGLVNQFFHDTFGVRPFNIYSWWGIIWVHLMTGNIAIKVVLLIPAFRNLDGAFEEASRLCGMSTTQTLWKISVPLVMPAILVVTLMSIATSLQSFEVELVLGPQAGIDVYSTLMYRFVTQDPAQFGPATALGVLVMVVLMPLAIWQYQLVHKRNYSTLSGSQRSTLVKLGPWRWAMFSAIAFYLVLSLVVPLILLIISTFMKYFGAFNVPHPWTLDQWKTVLNDEIFMLSLWNTLMLGVGAAALAVIWFSLVAYVLVRYKGIATRFLDFLCWLPWAVPGVIMGLGFLWMVLSIDLLHPLHSTMFLMILAVTLGSITPGTQMLKTSLTQINADLEGASRISGGTLIYTLRRIVFPLMTPTLIAVGTLSFVAAVRDIGRLVFVVGGTNRPLALLQLDLMVSERLEAAAVVGVIIALLSVGVAAAVRTFGVRLHTE